MMKSPILGVHPRATRLVCTKVSMAVMAMHRPQKGVEASSIEMNVTMIAILALVMAYPKESKTLTTPRLTTGLASTVAVVARTVVGVIAQAQPTVSTDLPTHLVHLQVQLSHSLPMDEITVALAAVLRAATTTDLVLHSVPVTLQSRQSTTRALQVVDTAQEGRCQVTHPLLIPTLREVVVTVRQLHMDHEET